MVNKQAQNQPCILCGGEALANTEEHLPPKILFQDRQWPVDYVFPACHACNHGSRDQDAIIGFLARLTDIRGYDDGNLKKLLSTISKRNRPLLEGMLHPTRAQMREAARKLGLKPAPGQLWRDLPILKVPQEIEEAVEVFAAKLTKALHYKHTGKIVPSDAAIWFRWMTNAQRVAGQSLLPQPLPFQMDIQPTLVRNGQELNNQFDYDGAITQDQSISVFACGFGDVFAFVTFLSIDHTVMERIIGNARRVSGLTSGGLKRIYWPKV